MDSGHPTLVAPPPGPTVAQLSQRTGGIALAVAQVVLWGFNKHYRLFRAVTQGAKARFEQALWQDVQEASRARLQFYDKRVAETVERLEKEFQTDTLGNDFWQQVKFQYINLLLDHLQPECAETFFNSVTTKILHRTHFHNDFIFVRPAVSTEFIENDEPAAMPTYRSYYPTRSPDTVSGS